MSPRVILVVSVWILLLATAWLGFVMWLRVRELRVKHEERARSASRRERMLGAFADDDREALSDIGEKFREDMARRRASMQREHGPFE